MNFNGTKNVDPAIVSSEIKNIKNIDNLLHEIKVHYIYNGEFETETFNGSSLRERSNLVLTPEGFCYNLFGIFNIKENVPINVQLLFLKSDDLHAVKMTAEPRRGRHMKFKFRPFSTKGERMLLAFGETPIVKKFLLSVNKVMVDKIISLYKHDIQTINVSTLK